MQRPVSELVETFLRFSERRTGDQDAVAELRQLLKRSGCLEEAIYGHAGDRDGIGQQVVLRGSSGGYISLRIFYDDYLEPLILRKGSKLDAIFAGSDVEPSSASDTSCCLTNGTVCCGSMCTDHVTDDPCPGGSITADVPYDSTSSAATAASSKLFDGEREVARQVANLATKALDGQPPDLKRAGAHASQTAAHGELLFASEPDGKGAWFDWILKLSNGAVLTVQVATNPTRKPLAFRDDKEGLAALKHTTQRWSYRQAGAGVIVGLFRAG